MYLLAIFFPLLSFLICSLFGRFFNKNSIIFMSTFLMSSSSLISYFIFYEVILSHSICSIKLMNWIESDLFFVSWGFLFDSLTTVMLIVVTTISALVHLYSGGYMYEDPHLARFMSYLSLFTFFMLMLMTADNFVSMFLGWEGVGLSSYLLINFWHTSILANKAAMKALMMNRIGDFGLALGMTLVFYTFYSLDFSVVFSLVPSFMNESFYFLNFEFDKLTIMSILLFIGAMGKSAQIGLHTWLPDAMEGPTPVSALMHAATMVTAGVFVVLSCSPLLEYASFGLFFMAIIGAMTAFMAATIGLVQNDLKKVIAYSTCSQLGYMMFACGLSNYSVSLFHLMNHAFFKALLFLSAGSVMHALMDEQDMRKMGGLVNILPMTYVMMLMGSLSLMGFPFLTGFYSKDLLLELTYAHYSIQGMFAYWLGVISAFFTSFYSMRLLYLTFFSNNNSFKVIMNFAHESPLIMLIPFFILCFGSIFVGYIMKDLFVGVGTDMWVSSMYMLPEHLFIFSAEFLPFNMKLIPVIFSISGSIVSLVMYYFLKNYLFKMNWYINLYFFYSFFSKKWYFDVIYNYYIVKLVLFFSYNMSFKLIDRGLIEKMGPLGIVRFLNFLSSKISKLQSGLIYHYILILMLGLFSFVSFIFYFDFMNFIMEMYEEYVVKYVIKYVNIVLDKILKMYMEYFKEFMDFYWDMFTNKVLEMYNKYFKKIMDYLYNTMLKHMVYLFKYIFDMIIMYMFKKSSMVQEVKDSDMDNTNWNFYIMNFFLVYSFIVHYVSNMKKY